jgi:hypothetical protein
MIRPIINVSKRIEGYKAYHAGLKLGENPNIKGWNP